MGNLALYQGEGIILGKSAAYINSGTRINRLFLYHFLRSEIVRIYFSSELTGTTIHNLSLKSIRNTPTLVPPLAEQVAIAKFVSNKDSEFELAIRRTNRSISLLSEYRTALISAAVTGKIDVRDVGV
ncbi:MAG: restriction endonuclease subunit S [Anaerolineae bacterium]|nr:restriction endonuclease subunit S [Anaerolineae bacterium]